MSVLFVSSPDQQLLLEPKKRTAGRLSLHPPVTVYRPRPPRRCLAGVPGAGALDGEGAAAGGEPDDHQGRGGLGDSEEVPCSFHRECSREPVLYAYVYIIYFLYVCDSI